MMSKIKLGLAITVISLIPFISISQSRPKKTIRVDIKEEKVNDADLANIPFDESFELKGENLNGNEKFVRVRYGINGYYRNDVQDKPHYKPSKHYFLTKSTLPMAKDGTILVARSHINNGKFKIDIPPLHPNENYNLFFDFTVPLQLSEAKKNNLDNKVVAQVDLIFEDFDGTSDESDLDRLRDIISSEVQLATNNAVIYLDSDTERKLSDIDILDLPAIKNLVSNIYAKKQEVRELMKDLNEPNSISGASSLINFFYVKGSKLINSLKILTSSQQYDSFKDNKIEASLNSFATYSYLYEFLINDYEQNTSGWQNFNLQNHQLEDLRDKDNNSWLYKIITGSAKFKDNKIVFAQFYDVSSLLILNLAFEKLLSLESSDNESLLNRNEIAELLGYMDSLIRKSKAIQETILSLETIKTNVPSILNGTFSDWTVKIGFSTDVVIDSKETPYIGLDIGYLWTPSISSSFISQSVNFHFLPVNRNAKISQYKSLSHKILKNVSVSFGLAQRIGDYDNDRFVKLTDLGSPYVGLGFRISRMVRLSGGVLFYNEEDPSPIISRKVAKGAVYASLNLDFKLKDALGIVGNLFKSNP